MMNVMNVKCKFTIDEVINLTENCYYVTTDDVADLCDLREIGFENVRWVGTCWIAEKCEGDEIVVCLGGRIRKMLNEYCEKENKNEIVKIKTRVEDLMYDLNDSLDKWNGNNMRNVNRIVLVLEDLENIFKRIRDKQIER